MRKKKNAEIQIKNVVIYARYSSDRQNEQSIDDQIAVCERFAAAQNYNIVGKYYDKAMTGRNAKRPGFQKMIRASDNGLFDGVLVYATDRFSRNKGDHVYYKKELAQKGIRVISATEPISSDPMGIIMESMLEGYSEYYVTKLSNDVSRGMYSRANACLSTGGPLPLGYKIESKKYVIDEPQAAIVREIFQKFADGWSYQQMCKDFNDRGLKTSKGEPFNKNSFFVILRNRKYLGFYIYGDVEIPGGMPQIVSDELFGKVAARMELNKKAPGRNRAKAEYLLTQKMYCGYCGEMMIGHSSNKVSKNGVIYNYYRCKNAGGKRPCKKKMMGKDFIEDMVVKECKKLLTDSNIHRIAKEVVKIAQSDEAYVILNGLEANLRKLQKEQQNQMLNLRKCSSDLVRDMIIADIEKLSAEIADAEKQISIEKANRITITEEQVIERLSKLANGNILDLAYRRALIRIFVDKILIYDDKTILMFKTGDKETEITPELLNKIERGLGDETLCFSEAMVHHEKTSGAFAPEVFYIWAVWESKGRPRASEVKNSPGDCFLGRGRFPYGSPCKMETNDQTQHSTGALVADGWTAATPYFFQRKNANNPVRATTQNVDPRECYFLGGCYF